MVWEKNFKDFHFQGIEKRDENSQRVKKETIVKFAIVNPREIYPRQIKYHDMKILIERPWLKHHTSTHEWHTGMHSETAVSKKVALQTGKSLRDNVESYYG